MKNNVIIILIFLIPLSIFFFLEKFTGNNSVNAASDIKGPKLVKFYSPMCSECGKVAQNVNEAMKDYENIIAYEEINVGKSDRRTKNLISSYGVTVVPTLIFIDRNDKVCNKKEGMIEIEEIKTYLDKIKQ